MTAFVSLHFIITVPMDVNFFGNSYNNGELTLEVPLQKEKRPQNIIFLDATPIN